MRQLLQRRDLLKSATTAAMLAGLGRQHTQAATRTRISLAKGSSTVVTGDGTNLFYRDWGSGKPVVFIAGWGMPSDMWNYQMTTLSERGFRCIAYDRRGHGRSSDPGRGFDYDTLAHDLAAVLDALDLRSVVLVSHSMGCGEVIRYLTHHGASRIARIALVAPATPYFLKSPDNPYGVDASVFDNIRKAMLLDFPKWMEENGRPFVVKETSEAMIEWLKGLMLRTSMKALIECHRTHTAADFRAELTKLTVPALVIHGDKDVGCPIDLTGRKTAAMIPGARLKVYEGSPHGLFVTHIDRLNADLLEFAG